ncbi:hypothetical protein JCM10908_004377 [Rhodotorula pacifica]|uniref:uncharacterized protein n=1 Tax=Rhodotorula pacifica TaxID=1495444 RepID=UPI00316BC631
MLLLLLLTTLTAALVAFPSAVHAREVFAHVMFGEVQQYEVQDYAADMISARSVGIDAFAVNLGFYSWETTQLERIFEAAEQNDFRLFYSFDMLHWNRKGASQTMLNDRLLPYAKRDTYHKIDGKIVISTFNGAQDGTYLDGVSSFAASNSRWNQLLADVKSKTGLDTYFAPCWLSLKPVSSSDAANLNMNAVMNWFAWGGVGETQAITARPDANWHDAARKRGIDYWAPVGAVFNVHQAPTNNYCYPSSDQFLIAKNYGDLIELGDKAPDYIEFITFNDWGESTYLGPVRANRNAPKETVDTNTYVSGHNHTAFLLLSSYYTQWYKSGTPPTITSEVIFWWSRQQPIASVPASDPLGRSKSCEGLTDNLFIVALLPEDTKASKVVVTLGSKKTTLDTKLQPGVNFLQTPFSLGQSAVSLQDSAGKEIVGGRGIPIQSEAASGIFDPNFFAFMEPRDYMPE